MKFVFLFSVILIINEINCRVDKTSNAKNVSQLLNQNKIDNHTTASSHYWTTSTTTTHRNQISNCTQPSINDFPEDAFTQTQRRFGAIIFHIFFTFYLLIAIVKVCDDYFMNSIEIIGERLNLDQDVSGATFMAVGSSAPEVFISLVGVFLSESDPGLSAVVGSAIFNILFVVGICGLLIMNPSKLTRWPFFRDSFFYCVSILTLVLLIRDNKVYWYESMALLFLYVVYCFFMMNNDRLKEWTFRKFQTLQQETKNILPEGTNSLHNKAYGFFVKKSMSNPGRGYDRFNENEDEMNAWSGTAENLNDQQYESYQNSGSTNKKTQAISNVDQLIASNSRQIEFATSVFVVMLRKHELGLKPKTRFRMAVRRVICEIKWVKYSSTWNSSGVDYNRYDCNPFNSANLELILADKPNPQEPMATLKLIKWVLVIPIKVILHFTIPDVRISKYRHLYVLSFIMSIFWFAILSYLIVWMITIIGYTFGISDNLMAISFIAAGTSIPDAYTSFTVVKEGMLDMGVSNIIGSNVFDLLVGLAFPWFISAILNNGYIIVNTNGLIYDSFLLFACVIVTVFMIHIRNWHLDRKSGYLFLSVYVAFLIFSAAIEMNVFSYVNPPTC